MRDFGEVRGCGSTRQMEMYKEREKVRCSKLGGRPAHANLSSEEYYTAQGSSPRESYYLEVGYGV
jgi:hypothetical protein